MDARNPSLISPEIALNPKYRDSESALLHALLQAADTAILMSGLDRQDIIANRRMGELFSVTPQDIVELDPMITRQLAFERVRNPEAFAELLDKTYSDPEISYLDEIELVSDPPAILRRFTGPVYDKEGQPIARLWTFQDITETKALQKEIQAQLTARTREIQNTSAILQAINALCRLTIKHGSTHDTLSETINIVQTLLNSEYIAILLLNQTQDRYEGLECVNELIPVEIGMSCEYQEIDMSFSNLSGRLFSDLENYPALCDIVHAKKLTCALNYAHLKSGEQSIGIIVLSGSIINDSRDRLQTIHLQALIDQISLTMENHQLQRDLQLTLERLRTAQRGMVEMEKLHTAGTLAASVAHDIRNILTAIQCELEADPSLASIEMHAQVNRFASLTHRLLAFSRPAVLDTVPTQLSDVISKVIPLISGQAEIYNVEISVDIPADMPLIEADSSQLDHVFVNLFLNAIQAMTTAGGTFKIKGFVKNEWLYLEFRDSGTGISKESMEQLFHPFFTTRATGVGLGLFSCKRIVEEHGGQITVQSELGEGTAFTLSFPTMR